jgi:hypothetical protein
MSRMLASRMGYEPERSLAYGAIGATYGATGVIGALFTHPIRQLTLQNSTNAPVSFSLDGVNTLITLQANVAITLDITTNRTADPNGLSAPIGWGFYARYYNAAPTAGVGVFMSAIYGAGAESLQ